MCGVETEAGQLINLRIVLYTLPLDSTYSRPKRKLYEPDEFVGRIVSMETIRWRLERECPEVVCDYRLRKINVEARLRFMELIRKSRGKNELAAKAVRELEAWSGGWKVGRKSTLPCVQYVRMSLL